MNSTNERDTALLRTTVLPLLVLLCLTLAAQLSSLAYTVDGSFLTALAPSVLVLCVVTIPLATLGLVPCSLGGLQLRHHLLPVITNRLVGLVSRQRLQIAWHKPVPNSVPGVAVTNYSLANNRPSGAATSQLWSGLRLITRNGR